MNKLDPTIPPAYASRFDPDAPARMGTIDLSKFPGCYGPSRPIQPPVIYKPGDKGPDGRIFSHYRSDNLYWPVFKTEEQLAAEAAKKERKSQEDRAKYFANHEERKAAARDYYHKNKERIKARNAERLEACPVRRFEAKARGLISGAFKRKKYSKPGRTAALLGCSIAEFQKHIERQFVFGMFFDNCGDWHIDHIVPIALAQSIKEVESLSHYTNLRPLWGPDNSAKSARLVPESELPENLHPDARAIYDRARSEGRALTRPNP